MGKEKIRNLISIIFSVIVITILFATNLLDKYIEHHSFPNEASGANGGYYLFAACLLGLLIWVHSRLTSGDISEKTYIISIIVIVILTGILETAVAVWAPKDLQGDDFAQPRKMAINLVNGGTFAGNDYFAVFSNQVNISLLLAFVYKVTGSWRAVILLGSYLSNISILMAATIIKKISGNRFSALIMCFAGEILVALAWRSFLPYTDIWGMPFVIGVVFLMVSDIRPEYKALLVTVTGMIAAWIKATGMIALLGTIIYILVRDQKTPAGNRKKFLSFSLCALLIVCGFIGQTKLREHFGYFPDDRTYQWPYWMLIGQNNDNTGQVGGKDYIKRAQEIRAVYETAADRNQAYLRSALKWIKNRGIWGNLSYYIRSLDVIFDDGRFHNVVRSRSRDTVAHNLIYECYALEGKYYQAVSDILQVLWDFVLLLIGFEAVITLFRWQQPKQNLLLELIILGIIAYLFVFERRSKYLFMFLPVFISFAGVMLSRLLETSRIMISSFSDHMNSADRLNIVD